MDVGKYYSTQIKPSVSKLPDSDRMLLIEALFNGMIKAISSYYNATNFDLAPKFIEMEAEHIKTLVNNRLKEIVPFTEFPSLEADPMEPTDKSFTMDAALDFNNLMKIVSKVK
jgi:hypothetical protein